MLCYSMATLILLLILVLDGVASDCPFPGIPNHGIGYIKGKNAILDWNNPMPFEYNERITYDCDPQWRIPWNESSSIECQKDGTWSGHVPKCVKIISNSSWKKEFFTMLKRSNKSVIYESIECNGFQYSSFRLHPQNMQLSSSTIVDVHVELCPGPQGQYEVSAKLTDWNEVNFNCSSSKHSINIFTCGSLRDTSSSVLYIEVIVLDNPVYLKQVSISVDYHDHCGYPSVPINAIAVNVSSHKYEIKCQEGFHLEGDEIITCDPRTGRWAPNPKCVLVSSDDWKYYIIISILFCFLLGIYVTKRNYCVQQPSSAMHSSAKADVPAKVAHGSDQFLDIPETDATEGEFAQNQTHLTEVQIKAG